MQNKKEHRFQFAIEVGRLIHLLNQLLFVELFHTDSISGESSVDRRSLPCSDCILKWEVIRHNGQIYNIYQILNNFLKKNKLKQDNRWCCCTIACKSLQEMHLRKGSNDLEKWGG